jgi:HEAT repeat protein
MMKSLRTPVAGVLALLLCATGLPHRLPAADAKASPEELLAKVKSELHNSDPAVREAAIGSLVHSTISGKLVTEMRSALADLDEVVRSRAATAIGNLGADAVAAIPQLIAGLKSDSAKEARETAARALGRIGKADPASRDQIVPALRKAAHDDADPVTRVVALGALAMVEVEMPAQMVALRKYLHYEDALVRMKAAHALGMLGSVAREAAPEIVDVLKLETDGHRRGYVARALGTTGDPASLPVLEEALKGESDPGAKGEMRGAISRLKAAAPSVKQ